MIIDLFGKFLYIKVSISISPRVKTSMAPRTYTCQFTPCADLGTEKHKDPWYQSQPSALHAISQCSELDSREGGSSYDSAQKTRRLGIAQVGEQLASNQWEDPAEEIPA